MEKIYLLKTIGDHICKGCFFATPDKYICLGLKKIPKPCDVEYIYIQITEQEYNNRRKTNEQFKI